MLKKVLSLYCNYKLKHNIMPDGYKELKDKDYSSMPFRDKRAKQLMTARSMELGKKQTPADQGSKFGKDKSKNLSSYEKNLRSLGYVPLPTGKM